MAIQQGACTLANKWKILQQIFFILYQPHFHAYKVQSYSIIKSHIFWHPLILLLKILYHMVFSTGSLQIVLMLLVATNYCKILRQSQNFLLVSKEIFYRIRLLNYVNWGIGHKHFTGNATNVLLTSVWQTIIFYKQANIDILRLDITESYLCYNKSASIQFLSWRTIIFHLSLSNQKLEYLFDFLI